MVNRFVAKAAEKGIRLRLRDEAGKSFSLILSPRDATQLACRLLVELKGMEPEAERDEAAPPVLRPDHLGLAVHRKEPRAVLMVRMGAAKFGVDLAQPLKLGETLVAIGENRRRKLN